jgi:signal transduction histidine kinase/ActR/RegA family two-component response regulator
MEAEMESVISRHMPSLALSLYRVDEEQLRMELKAMTGVAGISHLSVQDSLTPLNLNIAVGDPPTTNRLDKNYPLTFQTRNGLQTLGLLRVAVDLTGIYHRLGRAIWLVFLSNGFSIFLVALAVLLMTWFGVTRHLLAMVAHTQSLNWNRLGKPLKLQRLGSHKYPDEVSQLVSSLNEMQDRLLEDASRREKAESQKAEVERQLRQVQKMEALGTLAGGVAHDINNLLGVILGQTELAMSETDEKKREERLELAIQGVDRAQEVVRRILAFSRRNDTLLSVLDVGATLKEVADLLRVSVPKTIELRLSLPPGKWTVVGDETELQQVFMNLCTNAFHAMPEGGVLGLSMDSVHLSARDLEDSPGVKPGAYCAITISDTGVGIPQSLLDRIFEPYFTTKEVGKGTGLGLSLVHGIVKALSGHLTVHSEANQGTTFRVFLPFIEEKVDRKNALPLPKIVGGHERILLVEDEPALASAVGDLLEGLGYRVKTYLDSRSAWSAFQANPDAFDALVTDFTMPRMTGGELSERVLELRKGFPIVMCSGFSERMDESQARQIGIHSFVQKPVLRSVLARHLRAALDGLELSTPSEILEESKT